MPARLAPALRKLLEPDTRQKMSTAARQLAAQHNIEGNVDLWDKTLTN